MHAYKKSVLILTSSEDIKRQAGISSQDARILQLHVSVSELLLHKSRSPKTYINSILSMYRTIRSFRPSVTNVRTPKAGLIGGLAAVAARVPVRIYTLHGLRLETVKGPKGRLLHSAERLAMACAHRVVCVSPSLQERVGELGLAPAPKTVVLGSGSPNSVRQPGVTDPAVTASHRATLGLREDTPVIGFVGRFTRDKGMAELMEAFRGVQEQLPSARLLLIGDYEPGDPVSPGVRDLIERTPGVLRTGFVPDVYPYYPLMKVVAFPSYREGLSLVPLEAAVNGIPSVVTNTTGAKDTVRDGVTGWHVPVSDADALADALTSALLDPADTRRRGEAGRRWVTENFDPTNVQQRWADYYAELLHWRELSERHRGKRWMDAVLAGAGLVVLGAPLLLLALLVRFKLGSPVLFKQVRPGLAGQPFTMYKFRTMTDERDADGELRPDAVRLTAFGRFLRSTSLDELPELWNVLIGDMSLVGPRPLLMSYLPLYNERQYRRHEVRPGITGWAQVNGRNALSWEEKFDHDLWYVDNHSLATDLKILAMTFQKVFQREGISAQGEVTMPRFTGSNSKP
ncbi:sugar transferase [Deinococcus sp. ME38]|uniref:sugar transferase n=1 Tax=Deinococcus sp. ME38 TaxID=3400344 RepID=UPI003B5CBE9C